MAALAPCDFNLKRPRLRFAQKVDILSGPESFLVVSGLLPGIRQINRIRNELAHNLEAAIPPGDVQSLISHLEHSARGRAKAPTDPVVLIETFSAVAIAGMVAFIGGLEAGRNPEVQQAIMQRAA